jgi:hypothetical protein
VVLDVGEELAKGAHTVRIKDLFSDATTGAATREYVLAMLLLCIGIIAGTGIMVAAIHYVSKRLRKTKTGKPE